MGVTDIFGDLYSQGMDAVEGAKKAGADALDSAAHEIPYNLFLAQVDQVLDDAPGEGTLFTWVPPSQSFGVTRDRQIGVLPLGWATMAGIGAVVLWWAWKG